MKSESENGSPESLIMSDDLELAEVKAIRKKAF